MKRPLHTLIRLLGCMTMLLFLVALFFGIIFQKQDTVAFFAVTGSIAGIISIFSSLIYWIMSP